VRLLFITGSLVHGGAERHTITLSNKLAERGHECHAAYVKNDPSQLARFRGATSITCLHAARYFDFGAVRRLADLMRRVQPTSIVAANQYAMLYASLARRMAGIRAPLAVVWHTTLLNNFKEQVQMLYYRPLFWAAECVVFVCEAQRRRWHARFVRGRTNQVIYNGVDTAQWLHATTGDGERVRAQFGIAPDAFVVGMSAVLRPEKNHVQLVEALAALRARGQRMKALMIGDGPTRPQVEARARELGVEDDVIITGFQQDVKPFVAACDAVALTSFAEAMSLAAIEAMAMGKPVVHSDVGGAAEMIANGREGYLFPVNDTPALVERLEALSDRAACERMGAIARETVRVRFSEHAMVSRYEDLLMQLEGAGPGRRAAATAETVEPAQELVS